jgi:hypothetical protein
MTRRGDPARIYLAQRTGIFRRLVDAERVDELEAEHLLARWERTAEGEGIEERNGHAYWNLAWRWIAEQRASTRR